MHKITQASDLIDSCSVVVDGAVAVVTSAVSVAGLDEIAANITLPASIAQGSFPRAVNIAIGCFGKTPVASGAKVRALPVLAPHLRYTNVYAS